MNTQSKTARVLRALTREGLTVERTGPTWSVRWTDDAGSPASVLLPATFPLEGKALAQLANLASLRHPDGGAVTHCCATPDFHPGDSGVAIGSVVRTAGMVAPQAVGGDINCGMRLHVADLSVEQFLSKRDALVAALEGDFFLGSRDVVQTAAAQRAMFEGGLPAWLDAVADEPLGSMARMDLDQVRGELERVHLQGALGGHVRWAPANLVPAEGIIRDPGMATVGGGNHFVEFQVVDEVLDRQRAWQWGVRAGQVTIMVHSGSRQVGKVIAANWLDRARDAWPTGVPHPRSGLFPVASPDAVAAYLQAEATAAHYGFVNRLMLAELVRLRLRGLFGDLAAPLVYDVPHNITLPDGDGWIARKGACPADAEQPVIIPGSMGTPSYLMCGTGAVGRLSTASHGAGRALTRTAVRRLAAHELGLDSVDCVSRRADRRVEEAPVAYKPIQPVIDVQVEAGVVTPVARLRPLLTFKA